MPVHVGEVESDLTVVDGEMPFNERQLEKLVEMVCKHLEKKSARSNKPRLRQRSPAARRRRRALASEKS